MNLFSPKSLLCDLHLSVFAMPLSSTLRQGQVRVPFGRMTCSDMSTHAFREFRLCWRAPCRHRMVIDRPIAGCSRCSEMASFLSCWQDGCWSEAYNHGRGYLKYQPAQAAKAPNVPPKASNPPPSSGLSHFFTHTT